MNNSVFKCFPNAMDVRTRRTRWPYDMILIIFPYSTF